MDLVKVANGTAAEQPLSDEKQQQRQSPDPLTLYLQLAIQLAILTFTLVYLSLQKGAKVQSRPILPQSMDLL